MPFRRGAVSDEEQPEVEGHGGKLKFLDQDGKPFEIPEERIRSVKWTDAEGDHEVEGHAMRHGGLSDEPEVEGHLKFKSLSDQPLTIKFLDESGEEQEVEGHKARMGLSNEPDEVEGHGGGRWAG